MIDGRLHITGPQPPIHHAAVVALMIQLKSACPPDLMVAVGSIPFRPAPHTTLRPDLLICPRDHPVSSPPLLVIEVLSPTTHTTDIVLKRALYEHHNVPSYWHYDPTHQELTALSLTPTGYTCEAVVQAPESFHTTTPFPVTLTLTP
ncbi:hypothetical protein GCM10009804_72550 [Kribbella hippodromi]|uniref:Putative restriction endonuclease domain-containing protein n=1 Tax=Kribbella hippodromi TaxID=434347 RepID=A0ABN2EFA5_9ACTN